jgi:hypothetical protein
MNIEKWTERTIARWVNSRASAPSARPGVSSGLGYEVEHPDQAFDIAVQDRLRHTYILGSTGSGKTNLLLQLVERDITEKRSLVVLDMRGDLVDRIITRHAEHLDSEKLHLIDLRNVAISSGLNPFQSGHDPYGAALHVHAVLRSSAESWGVQLDETLRCSLIALSYARRSLADLPKLLGNAGYRSGILSLVPDEQVNDFFARFEQLSTDRQIAWTLPVLNKVSAFLSHPTIRAILQERLTLDLPRVLNERGSVTLVALAADRLHGLAGVFGCLVVSAVENAAMSRVGIPEEQRNPVHLYLDEFENFQSPAFESIIAEGRRFRLGLTLSHQNLHQLDSKLRHTITNNAATRIYFRTGHVDAKELGSELDAFGIKGASKHLLRLPVGEAFVIDSGAEARHVAFHEASRDSGSPERVRAILEALAQRTAPSAEASPAAEPKPVKHVRTPRAAKGKGGSK